MGLGITNHAGETGIAANVSAAVSDAYGRATRIGHGSADCHGLPRIASLIRELPASATGPLIATDCH
jgi:adenosine deaminase